MALVRQTPGCNGCHLARINPDAIFLPPEKASSTRLLVGDQPNVNDMLKGRPFAEGGPTNILASMYRKAGSSIDHVTCTNLLSCMPPNQAFPTDEAARAYCTESEGRQIVAHCTKHHLQPLLDSRPWTRIDAVGGTALKHLTGVSQSIDIWRGSSLPLVGDAGTGTEKSKVIGILEPLRLMKDSAMIPVTISDLQKSIQVPPQHYNLEPTLSDLENFTATKFTFDIETHGFTKSITCVGITDKVHHAIVVPFRGPYIPHLKRIFANATEIIGQNLLGFDLGVLDLAGVRISKTCQVWDVMLMQHLLQPDLPHDLGLIASVWTNMRAWKHTMRGNLAWYNACDVDATHQIFTAMLPVLKQQGLLKLYKYCQVPLAKICKLMSEAGVKVDPNRIKFAREKFIVQMDELEKLLPAELQPYDKSIRVRQPAPKGTLGKSGKPVKYIHVPATERVVPWNSPDRVAEYLYKTLKLPEQKHPRTKKLSTAKQALAQLFKQTQRPEIDALRKIRSIEEMLATFLKENKDENHVAATRVHSNFLVHGTNSGRLASSGPNMQNIPPQARYIYVPSHADWGLIEADFSSLENRLASWYAGDVERLNRLAQPGFNEHRWLASKLYNMPESEITKDMWQYKHGKVANHGADGGMGARKLAITEGMPEKDARELLLKWGQINPKAAEWQKAVGNEAVNNGVLVTAFGRKRWFWSHTAYTEGIRFKPQSSGADICFRAMISLMYDRIDWSAEDALQVVSVLSPLPFPAQLILQVHDSLLVEAPLAMRDEVCIAMRTAMSQPWAELGGMSVPVAIKVGEAGDSWAELEEWN